MGMIEVKKDFTQRELLWFGPLLALFVTMIGAVAIVRHEAFAFAYGLWGFASTLIVIYYLFPVTRIPLYRGWMYAVMPIGWVVSHVLLAVIYYLLLTPIGVTMRLCGYDPMQRRFDPTLETYWVKRSPQRPASSYFKQY